MKPPSSIGETVPGDPSRLDPADQAQDACRLAASFGELFRHQPQTGPLIVISYESTATIGLQVSSIVPGQNVEGAVIVHEGPEEAFDEVALALTWEGMKAGQ
jgi:hypothetical protein